MYDAGVLPEGGGEEADGLVQPSCPIVWPTFGMCHSDDLNVLQFDSTDYQIRKTLQTKVLRTPKVPGHCWGEACIFDSARSS